MSKKSGLSVSQKNNLKFSLLRGAAALGIALVITFLLIFLSSSGSNAGEKFVSSMSAIRTMLVTPFVKNNGSFNAKSFTDILAGMVPIIFTGLATCVMFSANQFNLGAEGGIMLGAFIGGLIAVYWKLPGILLPIVSVVVSAAAVGAMMLIPAVLKAKLGVSEMVNSLMLNYIIQYLINYLMNTKFADTSKGSTQTYAFQDNARLAQLIDNGSGLSVAFIIAIIFVVLIWYFMYRTKWGYGIRMTGINQPFVMYSGMNVALIVILCQVVGGILAGMGGSLEMLGRNQYYNWSALPGYGWTGITVAILAGNNPAYVPLAAFFMSYLTRGCTLMATYNNVPSQLISIIQAVIFVFFAAEQFLAKYHQKLVVRTAQEELKEAQQAKAAEGGTK